LSEKYLKKLIGKTEIEDALKRLDKLTNEEVRMVTAQVLEATHTVDDRVREVEDKVLDVDDKVAGIDDRVAGVDDRVASVDDKVKAVDDKVAVVIDGAQPTLISHQGNIFNSDVPRWKRDKGSHGSSESLVIFFLC
jgi:archaellum component FlaC